MKVSAAERDQLIREGMLLPCPRCGRDVVASDVVRMPLPPLPPDFYHRATGAFRFNCPCSASWIHMTTDEQNAEIRARQPKPKPKPMPVVPRAEP